MRLEISKISKIKISTNFLRIKRKNKKNPGYENSERSMIDPVGIILRVRVFLDRFNLSHDLILSPYRGRGSKRLCSPVKHGRKDSRVSFRWVSRQAALEQGVLDNN